MVGWCRDQTGEADGKQDATKTSRDKLTVFASGTMDEHGSRGCGIRGEVLEDGTERRVRILRRGGGFEDAGIGQDEALERKESAIDATSETRQDTGRGENGSAVSVRVHVVCVCVYFVRSRSVGCCMAPCSLTLYTILLHVAAWLPLICGKAAQQRNTPEREEEGGEGWAHLDAVTVVGKPRGNGGGAIILIQEHRDKHSLCIGPALWQLGDSFECLLLGLVVADLDDGTQVEDMLDLELAKSFDSLFAHHSKVSRPVQDAPLYHGAVEVLSGTRCNGISARIAEVSEAGGHNEWGRGESDRGCHDLVSCSTFLPSFVLFLATAACFLRLCGLMSTIFRLTLGTGGRLNSPGPGRGPREGRSRRGAF